MQSLLEEISSANITHLAPENKIAKEEIVENVRRKIVERGDLAHITVTEQLEILDDLKGSSLGSFLLERKGANGFWTDYILNYPNTVSAEQEVNIDGKPLSKIENFIINRAPVTLAHRERFSFFQREAQKRVVDGCVFASVPCGCMRDLLTLDYSNINDFKLYGIDIDQDSLDLAKFVAERMELLEHVNLLQMDAWDLELQEHFDVITSSGLNVYEPNKSRVISLYRKFYEALKPGGTLITAVLTNPPNELGQHSEWKTDRVSKEDLRIEHSLFGDIIGTSWLNFRTTDEIYDDFKKAGFKKIEIVGDSAYIFPTVIATK